MSRKQTEALKAAIFCTFNELQEEGEPYSLIEWARRNPKEFYTGLMPRLLPKPVGITASEGAQFMLVYQVGDEQIALGEDGKPVTRIVFIHKAIVGTHFSLHNVDYETFPLLPLKPAKPG